MMSPQNARAFLTHDRFPGMIPYLRWARTPLGSLGLAMVASGLCGMFLHPQGFVVSFGVMVVMILGLIWPWLIVRGLSGTLSFDRSRCHEGESVAARITLGNRMPWGAWGVSVRGGFHDPAGDERDDIALVGLAFVPGWRSIAETVDFVPGCRGEYPRRQPRVVCGFPFGLREASRPLEIRESLLVWPRTFPVAAVPEIEGGHAANGLATRDAGHSGDPAGVRPYRRGDPLRRVHWALTAARGADRPRAPVERHPPGPGRLDTRPAAHHRFGTGQLARVGDPRRGEPRRGLDRPRGRGGTRPRRDVRSLARLGPGTHGGRARCDGANRAGRQPGHRGTTEHRGVPTVRPRVRVIVHDRHRAAQGGPVKDVERAGDLFVVLRAGAFGLDEGDGPTHPCPWCPGSRSTARGESRNVPPAGRKEVAFGR